MFSVVIPLYNKQISIPSTIESVLKQRFTDFELIIVNDGSTDNSLSVVKTFTDPRIRIIDKPNGGVSSARNAGIKAANSEWIAFLDGDDLWADYFLESITKAITKHPEASVFSTNCAITPNEFDAARTQSDDIYLITDYFKEALHGGVINSSCGVVKKSCFNQVGYFNEQLSNGEDADMWVRLSRKFVFCRNRRIAALYRQDTEARAVGRADIPLERRAVNNCKITRSMSKYEKESALRSIFNYTKLQFRTKNWKLVLLMLKRHHYHIVLYTVQRILKIK